MKTLLFLCSLFFLFFSCNKKETDNTANQTEIIEDLPLFLHEIDQNNLIGFNCSVSGEQSKSVNELSKLLIVKDYISIRKLLTNTNAAKKYLATIACETLESKKIIKLTTIEKNQILQNKISTEIVNVCLGCTYQEELTLKEMFTDGNFLSIYAVEWLDEILN